MSMSKGTGLVARLTNGTITIESTMAKAPQSIYSSTRSLAVHLYLLVKEGLNSGEAFATATILIVIIVGLNALASFIAKRLSRRLTGGKAI